MKQAYQCEIIKKEQICEDVFDFTIYSPEIAKDTCPGQFLHIDCGQGTLLRRPISICDSDKDTVRFIFEVKGKGTSDLSMKNIGDKIDVLGPLGHGFTIGDYKNPVIIGGGIGVFPLYKLAKSVDKPTIFLGFRSKNRVVMEDEFKDVSKDLTVATDDGSYGYNGYAVNLLEEYIQNNPCDVVYSCGPMPMLKAVKRIVEEKGIYCELSLEQRMGCGIGACLVCTCETVHDGTDKYMRVCKNGPVFPSTEVTLND